MRSLVWALGPVLSGWTLAGLIVRRRLGRAIALPLLLTALIASSAFVALAPHLYTWRVWLAKEAVHAALLFALALELAVRVLGHLPGAARVAHIVVGAVVGGVGLVVVFTPMRQALVTDLSVTVLPLVAGGLALLFTSLALMTAFFLVPEDPLHKAVLSSLPLYLILYCVWTAQLLGEPGRTVVDDVLPWVLVLVLVTLSHAAWRREEPPPVPASLVRFLWPWR